VYSYTKELISISFYYGVWNAFGIPQHVWESIEAVENLVVLEYFQVKFVKQVYV
jgi:hypothetical protein